MKGNRRQERQFDDAGGVWIVTGWVLGFVVWLGIVAMWRAGFTPVTPLVIIPPLLVVMIAAGSRFGGRRPSRSAGRPEELDPVPIERFGAVPTTPASGVEDPDVAVPPPSPSASNGSGTPA